MDGKGRLLKYQDVGNKRKAKAVSCSLPKSNFANGKGSLPIERRKEQASSLENRWLFAFRNLQNQKIIK